MHLYMYMYMYMYIYMYMYMCNVYVYVYVYVYACNVMYVMCMYVGIQDIDLGKSRCRDTCSVAQVHVFRSVLLGYH